MHPSSAPTTPDSALRELQPDLWVVRGSLPNRQMPRNMVVHRLADGSLLVHSVIALDEPGMKELEALGRPSIMIVPNGFHRMDAPRYKKRYPDLKVVCPAKARKAVEKVIAVDQTCEEALPAHGVKVHAPDGVKPAELVYEFGSSKGFALVMTDLMMNIPGLPGLEGIMLRLFGPGTAFGVTRLAKFLLVHDKAAFRRWLEDMAGRPGLNSVVVAHGEPVVRNVALALRDAAVSL